MSGIDAHWNVLDGAVDDPESTANTLEGLFNRLDADASGNISRTELEQAMKVMYGKPLPAKTIDGMMAQADDDGDGEISFPEFKMMMRACEKAKEESKKLEKTMGLWYTIRERGLTPSKEQKASEDMRQRRTASVARRKAKIEQALVDFVGKIPAHAAAFLPTSRSLPAPPRSYPLPAGGGLPPRAQTQTQSPNRKGASPSRARRKAADLEAGAGAEAPDLVDNRGCCDRMWQAIPTADEFGMQVLDFFDTYLPFLMLLALPASILFQWISDQVSFYLADPNVVAPPPPPASPDWMAAAQDSFYDLAQAQPAQYLALDLGIGFGLGALALFWKDITDWLERRRLRGTYQKLDDGDDAEEEKPVMSAQALRMELYKAINIIEELEIKLRVRESAELQTQLEAQQERRVELEKVLEQAGSSDEPAAATTKKKAGTKSEFAIIISNTANGFVTVSVYFADVISDVQVLVLLYGSGNIAWAALSLFFLVAQFLAIYIRVLPYLDMTFGRESMIYKAYLWGGFPFGSLLLDVLMFLEPFGLLAVLPLPMWLKTFIPAYKATRVIAEVFIESLPQCLLQAYILVSVMGRVHEGTARPTDLAMLDFASVLPQSITISTLATLKTWIELVQSSRKAGISLITKAVQLWNVGGGLPLDALKKGAIVEWACSYKLDEGEISPLLNALEGNSSLVRLHLALSGLEWGKEDSTGAPLIEAMATSSTALGGLQKLIISSLSECEIPIDQIRMGGNVALKALQQIEFFQLPGGAWHDEILLMGELLRRNRQATVMDEGGRKAGERIVKLLEEVHARTLSKSAWELRVKQMMVEGSARRAHLLSLVSIEVLRGVGFGALELHTGGLSLAQLKHGTFTVAELKREIGVEVRTLIDLGYTPKEMREGSVTAEELKPFGYSSSEMRQGTFLAPELKAAGYTLLEMREASYSTVDLKEADYTAAQLRKVGYTAAQCRKAEFKLVDMRTARYTTIEMRDGGYNATKVRAAGYEATEATIAFPLDQLKEAGYVARELREAGHSVPDMSKVGFTLEELHGGGYSVEALQAAGYTIAELKAVGTSLSKMKESGASAEQLRAAGYTAARLRTQDYSALELMEGGFNSTDLEKAGFDARLIKEMIGGKQTAVSLQEAGFSAKELRSAGFSAVELKGSFSPKVLRSVGYSEEDLRTAGFEAWLIEAVNGRGVSELKDAGLQAEQLKTAGFSVEELGQGGFPADVLKACGFSTVDLRGAGFSAGALKDAGSSLAQLKAAYFMVEELHLVGFSYDVLKRAGYTAAEFKDSGVSAVQLRRIGFSVDDLKAGGFSAKEMNGNSGQWDTDLLWELKNANFSAKELKFSGLTAKELKAVDFTVKDLEAAGFNAKDLHTAGFTGADMRTVGIKASTLRIVGYAAGELIAGGYSVAELRDGGFSANDLKASKISALALKQSGYTAAQLRSEGFTAKELGAGFSSTELKAVGYAAKEINESGISVQELKSIGFTAKQLKAEGFKAKELRLGGFLAKELKQVGFTEGDLKMAGFRTRLVEAVDGRAAKELKAEGFTADELRAAGFSAKELKLARFDAPLLKSVGYTPAEMRAGGFMLRDLLRDAGYGVKELKLAGFEAPDFLEAPCSITEMKGAGFTEKQCVDCGLLPGVVKGIFQRQSFQEIRDAGFTCDQAKKGGLLPHECHQAGYSYEEGVEAGFTRKMADWMSMDLGNPYNKWG